MSGKKKASEKNKQDKNNKEVEEIEVFAVEIVVEHKGNPFYSFNGDLISIPFKDIQERTSSVQLEDVILRYFLNHF